MIVAKCMVYWEMYIMLFKAFGSCDSKQNNIILYNYNYIYNHNYMD